MKINFSIFIKIYLFLISLIAGLFFGSGFQSYKSQKIIEACKNSLVKIFCVFEIVYEIVNFL